MANKVMNAMVKSPIFHRNKVISVYFGTEYVPLNDILLDNFNYLKNTFVYPSLNSNEIKYYHIYSPDALELKDNILVPKDGLFSIDANEIDIILVPGKAFDFSQRRLDDELYFYDNIIENTKALTVGVCLDCQIYRKDLANSNPRVEALLTEEGLSHYIDMEEESV